MKILIVNGSPKSGKDLFCENAHNNCAFIYPISVVDRIKQIALFGGWDGNKDAKGRKLLSNLKDAFEEYNDLPHEYVLQFIENRTHVLDQLDMIGTDNAIFLVQSREPKDIQRWVDENGARTLLIHREGMDVSWGNHADDEVGDYQYDYMLFNSGTIEDWEAKTVKFINQLRKESWESHV